MRLFLYIFLLSWWQAVVPAASSQADRPPEGVVWRPPASQQGAVADLQRMREMGIEVVRTMVVQDQSLLSVADALNLQLYQELPVAALPARRLLDTLGFAQDELMRLLRTAQPHRSARHFGLGYGVDTSDSTACAYFERLSSFARTASDGSVRVYYVTRFIEDDACSHTVDFVLLDALGKDDPSELVRRWRAAHPDVPVGIASVGRFVDVGAGGGLHVEGSEEAQARYLERSLRRLLRSSDPPAAGVFVYRWRDQRTEVPSPAFDLENPYRHAFGLFADDGRARPAADVVSGVFGRGQNVFAFAAGRPAPPGYPFSTIAGWIVLAILGIAYASSPRMRPMVPRYFSAHGFYREAVREGRDVLLTASIVLLVALALAVAIIWYVILDTWRTHADFLLLFQMMPSGVEEFIVTILGRPFLFLLLVGSIYGVSLTVWSAILSFTSRRRYPLYPAQALMLAIWPRWAVVLLMIAAMVVATLPPETAAVNPLHLLVAWVVITLAATGRTLFDFAAITRVPPGGLALGALLNPLVLILLALLVLALRYQPETAFLWHALTRT